MMLLLQRVYLLPVGKKVYPGHLKVQCTIVCLFHLNRIVNVNHCLFITGELFSFYILAFHFPEICAVSKVSKKEIGRCFKLTLRALETSVDLITSGDFMVCSTFTQ